MSLEIIIGTTFSYAYFLGACLCFGGIIQIAASIFLKTIIIVSDQLALAPGVEHEKAMAFQEKMYSYGVRIVVIGISLACLSLGILLLLDFLTIYL